MANYNSNHNSNPQHHQSQRNNDQRVLPEEIPTGPKGPINRPSNTQAFQDKWLRSGNHQNGYQNRQNPQSDQNNPNIHGSIRSYRSTSLKQRNGYSLQDDDRLRIQYQGSQLQDSQYQGSQYQYQESQYEYSPYRPATEYANGNLSQSPLHEQLHQQQNHHYLPHHQHQQQQIQQQHQQHQPYLPYLEQQLVLSQHVYEVQPTQPEITTSGYITAIQPSTNKQSLLVAPQSEPKDFSRFPYIDMFQLKGLANDDMAIFHREFNYSDVKTLEKVQGKLESEGYICDVFKTTDDHAILVAIADYSIDREEQNQYFDDLGFKNFRESHYYVNDTDRMFIKAKNVSLLKKWIESPETYLEPIFGKYSGKFKCDSFKDLLILRDDSFFIRALLENGKIVIEDNRYYYKEDLSLEISESLNGVYAESEHIEIKNEDEVLEITRHEPPQNDIGLLQVNSVFANPANTKDINLEFFDEVSDKEELVQKPNDKAKNIDDEIEVISESPAPTRPSRQLRQRTPTIDGTKRPGMEFSKRKLSSTQLRKEIEEETKEEPINVLDASEGSDLEAISDEEPPTAKRSRTRLSERKKSSTKVDNEVVFGNFMKTKIGTIKKYKPVEDITDTDIESNYLLISPVPQRLMNNIGKLSKDLKERISIFGGALDKVYYNTEKGILFIKLKNKKSVLRGLNAIHGVQYERDHTLYASLCDKRTEQLIYDETTHEVRV